ncbi:major facilitator superfamily transporter multidrug resistance [Grosmannia clavigera kw1407]|uniref:Major facilitator superfamily transporter multidrug resistance n=1 Tax=Grosmannia clavigera (strain kw1407 / UAMH 11150) TaxID=655863 RepID=F0XNF0_GROCL|nr:major facilitator superfamily transporter multidrug resistance [Grosmannia clavigera kw1407]EFX00914.1 major facilitator superfamily transporter multidrug resistance [Grosmannia clavigera kw1407]
MDGFSFKETEKGQAACRADRCDSLPPDSLKVDQERLRTSSESLRGHETDDSDPLEPLELALTPNLETQDEIDARVPISHIGTASSVGSSASRPPSYEVIFGEGDLDNPRNWPSWYRYWLILCVSYTTWVVVVYSTSYTSAIPGLMKAFNESSETVTTLGVTSALFGAALVSNSPATVVDISSEEYRAFYISLVSIAPLNGPVTGPVIGGFVFEYLGWRWDSWIVLILAGVAIALMFTVKETYAPVVLKAKAARIRKETGDDRYWCRYDQKISIPHLLKINMSRPFILSFTEPILWFFNIWISVVYGILYLCFVAYPIVFRKHRGWSAGTAGLAFVGMGTGTMLAIVSEPICRKFINKHRKDPETGRAPPEASARVLIIGAVLTPVGQLVFSWTCLPTTIHWAIPIVFGIPFGAGNTLTFIYGSNYLAGSYGIYAASALAGNTVMRSIFGATLPLAGPSMYAKMSPQWAGTFLGLLEVCLIPIPIVFLRYGERIRGRSRVIRQMREDNTKNENKRVKEMARVQRKEKEADVAAAVKLGDGSGPLEAVGARDIEKGVDVQPVIAVIGEK